MVFLHGKITSITNMNQSKQIMTWNLLLWYVLSFNDTFSKVVKKRTLSFIIFKIYAQACNDYYFCITHRVIRKVRNWIIIRYWWKSNSDELWCGISECLLNHDDDRSFVRLLDKNRYLLMHDFCFITFCWPQKQERYKNDICCMRF